MVLRRNFLTSFIVSILGFFSFKKTESNASVENWVEMEKNKKHSFPKRVDFTLSEVKENLLQCKIVDGKIHLTKGKDVIVLDEKELWKTNFGPLFEVIVPSIYISLNPDETINNIWSPHNVSIGIAKHDGSGGLESFEKVKFQYNLHDENSDEFCRATKIYPFIDEEDINIIQETYVSSDKMKKYKNIAVDFLDRYKNGWEIDAKKPVRVKKDGKFYIIQENSNGCRFLVPEEEKNS